LSLSEFRLDGNVAVINGSNELAKASALVLIEAGCDVTVTGRDDFVTEMVTKGEQLTRKVLTIPHEVINVSQAKAVVRDVLSSFGRLDILVNAVGVNFVKPFLEMSEEEWQGVVDVNLGGLFACCKAIGEVMVQQGKGRIVNITSGLGVRGLPGCSAYCTTMGGVIQLTRTLAMEWAKHNVRVNAIGVGWFSNIFVSQDEASEARLQNYIPLGRRGTPKDIKWLLAYLSSDLCDYITGQTFFITGGLLARS